jgi:hypothetical protein
MVAEPAAERCPVCAEVLPAGALKCKACGALRSWVSQCQSCGAPIPQAATVCYECGQFPRHGRPCAACKRPLPPGANTCGACGALQWFRGYLQLSQSSLSLLVALISALTALGAVLSTLHLPRSETRVFFQAIAEGDAGVATEEERKLWLEIDNFGNRPSRIRGVKLILHGDRDVTLPVKIIQPSIEQLVVQGGGRPLMLQLESPDWSPQDFSIPTRADPKFEQFLTNNGHRLELMVVEYGSGAMPKPIEEMPAWVLPTLLCRGALGNPPNDLTVSDSCEQLATRLASGGSKR